MLSIITLAFYFLGFDIIILLNKMYKYHMLVFGAELIYNKNPKSTQKIPLAVCRGNQGDAKFLTGLQK